MSKFGWCMTGDCPDCPVEINVVGYDNGLLRCSCDCHGKESDAASED